MARNQAGDLLKLFEDLQINANLQDAERLQENMELLRNIDLDEINNRLLSQNRSAHFLSALTEHNFTASLLKDKPQIKQIAYEPEGGKRPPDLHIVYEKVNYWIQIKRLSRLKRSNIQGKIFKEIEMLLKTIEANKFINLQISGNFSSADVEPLKCLIEENLLENIEDKEYDYYGEAGSQAKFSFRDPRQLKLDGLTIGIFGNLRAEWITGDSRVHIKESLKKAIGAFDNDPESKNVNLIVVEMDQPPHDAIDLCEALYGSEYMTYDSGSKKVLLHRYADGLFEDDLFLKKISGVVVLKRKNHLLIDDYWQVLCVNPILEVAVGSISRLIKIDKEIKKYTGLGEGFFGLD